MRRLLALAATSVLSAGVAVTGTPAFAASAVHSEILLFDGNGESFGGVRYHSFRIPSLLRTTKGTLLAFAEGRAASNRDYGNINVMVKRSTTNGQSWSGLDQVVGTGPGTWGNPTGVVDQNSGTIFLFLSWNAAGYSLDGDGGTTPITAWGERKVMLFTSSKGEDGETWRGPTDLTSAVTPKKHADGSPWAWDAVGPGAGIQTSSGRLIVPATNRTIYSDDGVHFTSAPMAGGQEITGESTLLELTDGRLMRNDTPVRGVWETAKSRWVTRGTVENGFGAYAPDSGLPDPHAEASILRYNLSAPPRVVFLNSASSSTRTRMTIRVSTDEARTWPVSRPLSDAPLPAWPQLGTGKVAEGGYSSMAKTADKMVGALVEVNEDTENSATSHRSIVFRKVNLPRITG